MGIYISYVIGFMCVLFPRDAGLVIAELLDQISKRKYGPASPEEKKVRPVFSVLVGVVILIFTRLIQARGT